MRELAGQGLVHWHRLRSQYGGLGARRLNEDGECCDALIVACLVWASPSRICPAKSVESLEVRFFTQKANGRRMLPKASEEPC